MAPARDLLRRAENGDGLEVDGEPLTVERVKAAMAQAFAAHGATADEFIVAPGPQGAVGHDMGAGPIAAGRAGRDRHLAARQRVRHASADMTRTFVVGDVARRRRASGTGSARRRSTARWPTITARRRPAARSSTRTCEHLRGSRRADAAHEGAGQAARRRVLPRARPRRRARGARGARPGPRPTDAARAGDVVTRRAGPLPAGLRRRAARGSRARHRGRRREPDAVTRTTWSP